MSTALHSLSSSSFSRLNQKGFELGRRKDVESGRRRGVESGKWSFAWETLLGLSSTLIWHRFWGRAER